MLSVLKHSSDRDLNGIVVSCSIFICFLFFEMVHSDEDGFLVSGWHICTTCQKDSFYMCYTCPYSVCKRCVRSSEYVVVRENKGFCGICMKTIMLIENAAEANKEKV